MLSGLVICRFC